MPHRVQASFHAPSVALEWAATASSAMVASTWCTRNAVGSSAWKKTLTTDGHGLMKLIVGQSVVTFLSVYALQSSGEFPCAVCCTGVGSNSIFCNGCKHWVHKKCSGLKRLKKDPDYRWTRCQETACPLDGRPQEVQVGPNKLEVVARRHALSSRWL